MRVADALGIRKGDRVAVVGSGGKTALIDRLADENPHWSMLIAPTTRIGLEQVRERPAARYLGIREGDKLAAAPLAAIEAEAKHHDLTLMEADGSKGFALKGWAAHEPVVPAFTTLTVGVACQRAVGLVANGQNVHRLALFLEQAGMREGDVVTEGDALRMIRRCLRRHAVGRTAIAWRKEDGEWTVI